MCTVSFVYSNGKIIITSNRDEQIVRPSSPPKNYLINNKKIIFPKDPKAGGTWFAIDDTANVLVLLNGAAEKHQWQPPYRRSRGLIVLDIMSKTSPLQSWETIDLNAIEPFTLVLFQEQKLYQLRWNGDQKETLKLDVSQSYVWSSSTLYSQEIRDQRASWFYQFLESKAMVTEKELMHFHQYTHTDNTENGLVINRNNALKTLSITQTVIEQNKVEVFHRDLINQDEFFNSFVIL